MTQAEKSFSIKTTYVVYAPPDKVFEALTNPEIIAAWSGGLSVVELKKGGKFELFDGWTKGEMLSFKKGKELSYSWKPNEWNKKTRASVVHYQFREHPAGTEIIMEHTGIPNQEEKDKHANGWVDYVFDPLNEYFTSLL